MHPAHLARAARAACAALLALAARAARAALLALAARAARAALLALAALAALAARPGTAAAHGTRTAYLELEARGDAALAHLRTPAGARATPIVEGCLVEPEGARAGAAPVEADGRTARTFVVRCGSLVGARIRVTGLGGEIDDAVVAVRDEQGREHTAVLTGEADAFVVPAAAGAWRTAAGYVEHGVRHIATGLDHILLLLLLVLQLGRLRPILVVETAFSISHGLAFAATALGWIRIAPAPVEACIAASLVLLALDVARRPGHTRELALLALVFGLVHGLGFAGGLRELGVPEEHAAAAIIGFGAGVELGQLAFVLVAWSALAALRRAHAPLADRVAAIAATGAGGLAMYWLIDRARSVVEGA